MQGSDSDDNDALEALRDLENNPPPFKNPYSDTSPTQHSHVFFNKTKPLDSRHALQESSQALPASSPLTRVTPLSTFKLLFTNTESDQLPSSDLGIPNAQQLDHTSQPDSSSDTHQRRKDKDLNTLYMTSGSNQKLNGGYRNGMKSNIDILPIRKLATKRTAPLTLYSKPTAKRLTPRATTTEIQKDYTKAPLVFHRIAKSSLGTALYFPTIPAVWPGDRKPLSYRLLGVDIHQACREARILIDEGQRAVFDGVAEVNATLKKKAVETQLWVDKYAPTLYIDLVGDEQTHRQVLSWVKQWDYCVFQTHKQSSDAFTPRQPKDFAPVTAHIKEQDPLKRPDKKILLLGGRAGRGKTTLAHVVARHAGYNVIEINASDERTGTSLAQRIHQALSPSLLSTKPNLLIIDEIDGASQSGSGEAVSLISIRADLVELHAGASGPCDERPEMDRAAFERVAWTGTFAPVLKLLRPLSQLYTHPAPTSKQLSTRLLHICKLERLHTDMKTLLSLCESADGDIRSCLHELQFSSRTLGNTERAIGDFGMKDMQVGYFGVMEKVFF